MNDEYELEMSPLCQAMTRDNKTVQIDIYKGVEESVWMLEVIDSFGNSTVWDDPFKTDIEALTEVLSVIEKEGITSLIDQVSDVLH